MGFVFHENWWTAIENLPRDVQGDVLTAIIEYGLYGETTEQLKPIAKAILGIVKPQINADKRRECNVAGSTSVDATQQIIAGEVNSELDGTSVLAHPCKQEDNDNLAKKIEEYKHNQPIWKESIQMKFGISAEQVDKLLDEFYLDIRCKEIDVYKIASFFVGWLTRRQYDADRRNNEAGQWSGRNGVKYKGAVDFDCGLVLPKDSGA